MKNSFPDMTTTETIKLVLLSMLLCSLGLLSPAYSGESKRDTLDANLSDLIANLDQNNFEFALESVLSLKNDFPKSRVVQLLYADLQNVLAFRPVSLAPDNYYSKELLEVLNELKVRDQQRHQLSFEGLIPGNIIMPGKKTKHIIAIDLSLSRLFLLSRANENSPFRVNEHHYISIGRGGVGKKNEGDLKTPTGIYRIKKFKSDKELPPLYGLGAFTLDFPNELDKHQNITGSGIWLHGIPKDQFSRPPLTSEGCVVMGNEYIIDLLNTIDHSNTPVILAEKLTWSTSPAAPHPLNKVIKWQGHPLQTPSHPLQQNIEVFEYPKRINQKKEDTIVQVRFLLLSEEESKKENQQVTQYWTLNSTGEWNLLVEKSEKL